jgi:hypothetical protein
VHEEKHHEQTSRYAYTFNFDHADFPQNSFELHFSDSVKYLDGSSRDGASLPGYRSLISRGLDAMTGYAAQRTKLSLGSWSCNLRAHSDGSPVTTRYSGGGTFSPWANAPGLPASTTVANNQALMNFVSKARSTQTKFQGGIFLGELSKTLHQIRHPAQALRAGVGEYLGFLKKRRHNIKPTQKRKFLSETWLEYSYGWKPLIHDIQDACKAALHERSLRNTIPISGSGSSDEHSELGTGFVGPSSCVAYRLQQLSKVKVKYYGAVFCSAESAASFQQKNFGLDLSFSNFVPTLWELIPYSFLVDYFVNIGDLLSALSFRRSDIAWAGVSTKLESKIRAYAYYDHALISGFQGGASGSGGEWLTEGLTRSPYTGAFIPSLEISVPGFGSNKWINLGALARTHRSLVPF